MANADCIGKMVVIPPHDYQTHEVVMYLAAIRDGRMYFFDEFGDRIQLHEDDVVLRLATRHEVAEDFLRDAGFRGSLKELPPEKADPLADRIYADVTEKCKAKASEWHFM